MVSGYFLGTLCTKWASLKCQLHCQVNLSIVADNVYLVTITVYPSSGGYFWQDNIQSLSCLQLVSWARHWIHCTQLASTVTRSQSNEASLACGEDSPHGCVADKLPQPCYALMAIWTKTSDDCFQHLVASMTWRIKGILRAKWGPTQYYQDVPNKVTCECISDFKAVSLNLQRFIPKPPPWLLPYCGGGVYPSDREGYSPVPSGLVLTFVFFTYAQNSSSEYLLIFESLVQVLESTPTGGSVIWEISHRQRQHSPFWNPMC